MAKTKTPQPMETATKFYADAMDRMLHANRIVARGVERAVIEQMGLVESTLECMRPLVDVKQPADMFAVQGKIANSVNERFVKAAQKIAEIQRETGAELKDVMAANVAAFAEHVPAKKAA